MTSSSTVSYEACARVLTGGLLASSLSRRDTDVGAKSKCTWLRHPGYWLRVRVRISACIYATTIVLVYSAANGNQSNMQHATHAHTHPHPFPPTLMHRQHAPSGYAFTSATYTKANRQHKNHTPQGTM